MNRKVLARASSEAQGSLCGHGAKARVCSQGQGSPHGHAAKAKVAPHVHAAEAKTAPHVHAAKAKALCQKENHCVKCQWWSMDYDLGAHSHHNHI